MRRKFRRPTLKPGNFNVDSHGLNVSTVLSDALSGRRSGTPVGVAVSGGGDSMALLSLARDWAGQTGAKLCVATVDHGLRPESAGEAELVARVCAEWQIPHQILKITGLTGSGNLSARAREARYDVLSEWACGCGTQTVLLGHTMDDQAETVLMRLGRGSGVEGLSGMSGSMSWRGVTFLRPLLRVRRTALRDFLVDRGISWVEDPTNSDPAYDRVKARAALSVLEPMGISAEGLSATADRLARQRLVLEADAERLSNAAVSVSGAIVCLNRRLLREALADTAMRLIARVLMETGGNPYRPRFRSLEPLYRRIVSNEETTTTLANCLIRLGPDGVEVRREKE